MTKPSTRRGKSIKRKQKLHVQGDFLESCSFFFSFFFSFAFVILVLVVIVVDDPQRLLNEEEVMLNHLCPILYVSNLLQLYPRAVSNATILPSSLGKSVDPVAQCFALLVERSVIVVDGRDALTEFHVHARPKSGKLLRQRLPGLIRTFEAVLSGDLVFPDESSSHCKICLIATCILGIG